MANQTLKQALGSGDSRAVIRAMLAGNRKRARQQSARAEHASKAAVAEMCDRLTSAYRGESISLSEEPANRWECEK